MRWSFRGKDAGSARSKLLRARALGYSFVRLETGNLQAVAIGLYVSAGFEPIPRYGPFASDPRSVCFEKRLG